MIEKHIPPISRFQKINTTEKHKFVAYRYDLFVAKSESQTFRNVPVARNYVHQKTTKGKMEKLSTL